MIPLLTAPTVVHVHTGFDRYIGRPGRGRRLRVYPKNHYANPYRIGRDGRRDQVLVLYENLWRHRLASRTRYEWYRRLEVLAGQRLGCWCHPQPCHGDVLVQLFREFVLKEEV